MASIRALTLGGHEPGVTMQPRASEVRHLASVRVYN